MLLHTVFFELVDPSEEKVQALLGAAREFLPGIDGVEQFAVGRLTDMERTVNVRDWQVCLSIGFRDQAAHDAYQQCEQHARFIEDSQANWRRVRVFDADCE